MNPGSCFRGCPTRPKLLGETPNTKGKTSSPYQPQSEAIRHMPFILTVYCPNCLAENSTDSRSLECGVSLDCPNCHESFNLFGYYESLYENVPLAKRLADLTVEHTKSAYALEGGEDGLRRSLWEKLLALKIEMAVDRIHRELTVFGNSFLVLEPDEDPKEIRPARLPDFEVSIGWEKGSGQAYGEQVQQLIRRRNGSGIIQGDRVFHLHHNRVGGPLGHSIYGLWTGMWYIVQVSPQALVNSAILGGRIRAQEVEATKKYAREQVVTGSGVPWFLVDGETPNPVQRRFLMESFSFDCKTRRDELARFIQYILLPKLAGANYSESQLPHFIWEKDSK